MSSYVVAIATMTVVGAGVVTGLLFAFSNFVMRALADMPAEQGMLAMQRINERIINPVFLLFFFGTPVACVLIATAALDGLVEPGRLLLAAGAVLYLAGPFAITLVKNVPLNNGLAVRKPNEAETAWPAYRKDWQFWNHIRSYLGVVSIACMAWGMANLGP